MAELGSGSGSGYPGAVDTDVSQEINSPNAGRTKARAEVINDAYAAIIALQTELGTNPAGSLTDVKTWLQTEHGADGTHDATKIVEIAGAQTVTGAKTFSGGVLTDTISEETGAAGVTIDGFLIKDSSLGSGLCADMTVTGSAASPPDANTIVKDNMVGLRANINGTGTPAYISSFNTTGAVTDDGVGTYTITINTDFADANYTPVYSALENGASKLYVGHLALFAGSLQVAVYDQNGTSTDSALVTIIAIGDQ